MLTLAQLETRFCRFDRCLAQHQQRLDWLRGKLAVLALLVDERARRVRERPPLTIRQILAWADAHRERTGRWPLILSGAVPEAPSEKWHGIDRALRQGKRGLPGGFSLAQLLRQHRGKRPWSRQRPRLTVEDVLVWVDAWKERTGYHPQVRSGPIPEAPHLTWQAINQALRDGGHGLPRGTTLLRLILEHRGQPVHASPVGRRKGEWPRAESRRTSGSTFRKDQATP